MDKKSLNLQKFPGKGTKISRKISITKSNSFGIPPTFYKENDLDSYDYANLYYDPGNKIIGLEFSNNSEPGSFKLTRHGTGDKTSASFVARSFFKTYNIDSKKYYGRYSPDDIMQDGNKIFLIEIKERDDS
ncbi:MAG: hypothetical protein PHO91_01560 [Patescibacteria group bacterium]|nr:hypothetical protein [Patescibacteria group bacterium]